MNDRPPPVPFGTPTPTPRTLLSWQRTLLALAGVAVLVAWVLAEQGSGALALVPLVAAGLAVPASSAREGELSRPVPPPVGRRPPLVVAFAVVALAGTAVLAATQS